jgi:phage FluMu protein Com
MRLYGVRKLVWAGGLFYVHLQCRACKRMNCFSSEELLERHFPLHERMNADIDRVMQRARCTGCGKKNAVAWTMAEPMDPSLRSSVADAPHIS